MNKLKSIRLVALAAAGVIILIGYIITHSLWFLSRFVPSDSNIVWAAKGGHPFTQLLHTQSRLIGLDLEQEGINFQDYSHIVIAKTAASTHVVGITNSLFQTPNTRQKLQPEGWHVQAVGPYVNAQKGAGVQVLTAKTLLSRSGQGIWHLMKHASDGINPISIIHVSEKSIPLADTAYDAVITVRKDMVQTIVKHPHGQQAPPLTLEKTANNIPSYGLKFALSGKMLSHIPARLQTASLAKMMDNLHINRKQSDLAALIKKATFIAGVSNHNETGLAIMGESTGLATAMQNIVAAEEGYYHPQRGAFRLPDGSIGFEFRPGTPSAVWSQVNESCGYYNGQNHQWWVCNNGKMASLGTSQPVAQMLLAPYDERIWTFTIGQDTVPENLRPAIKAITATGTSEETSIIIQ